MGEQLQFGTELGTLRLTITDTSGKFIRYATEAESNLGQIITSNNRVAGAPSISVSGSTPRGPTPTISLGGNPFVPNISIPTAAEFGAAATTPLAEQMSQAMRLPPSSPSSSSSQPQQRGSRESGTGVSGYTTPAGPESTIRSAIAASAQTQAKIDMLKRNNELRLAGIAEALFGKGGSSPQQFVETLQSFDKVTRDRLMALFAQEIALNGAASAAQGGPGIGGGGGGGGFNLGGALNPFGPTQGNRFQGAVDAIDQSVSNQIAAVNETFKPVSNFLGETLGNLSRLVQDPVGTITLIPGSIRNVIERNNPEFLAKMEATYTKYNLDNIMHIPSIIAANLGGLISDIDALVSLPFILIYDLYLGLMDIINDLADAVQQIISNFIKKIFTEWLDGLLIQILEILQELSDLLSIIGGITTIFTGVTQFTQTLFNVQSYITQLGQFISNPLDLLFAYAPPQVSEALYLIRNPQQLVNNVLPPQLSQLFAKASQITGFGFNGNMGYGFVSVLQGIAQNGVIGSILNNFANQYPILTSILGPLNINVTPPNASQPPIVVPSPVDPTNEKIGVGTQGVPIRTQIQQDVVVEQGPPGYFRSN
jgi:hypothetical protein